MVIRPSKGGAFAHVAQLSAAFSERGHSIGVCGPHTEQEAQLAAELLPVDMVRPLSPRADAGSIAGVGSAIRQFKPDLIHAHGSKGGVIARLARAASPRTPLVFTPHGYAFENYFPRRQQAIYKAIERTMAPLATRVIGVCENERRLAAEIGPGRRTRMVYNGIEPPDRVDPDPRLAELRERGPLLLFVAELAERKGVMTLLEAMLKVRDRHPEASLALAGDGPEREKLIRRADELGLGESVTFLGHADDIAAVFSSADVFVSSSWAESLPYSVIEAMTLGIPTVATDVGGTREAIFDGRTGRLVPPRDPAALAEAINELLERREWACSLAEEARKLARVRFTLEQMIDGVLGVYAELGIPERG